ncbi:MAG: SDR family oxidoreductase [Bacteroidetes bacterium]|nr:SDR family oxidoreductase [Bacteroidota bacterium]
MQVRLDEKVVVVTGATGVLGEAFVRGISQAGARVVLLGRNRAVAAERASALQSAGGEALVAEADVLDMAQLEAALAQTLDRFGRVDGLVNAAGGNIKEAVIMPDADPFTADLDALRRVFDLNLFGSILPVNVFGPAILSSGGGSIVNISSMASAQAITRVLGYSLAKASIDNYTRWMSTELAIRHKGRVRMNAIAPGFFITHQNRALLTNPDGSHTPRGEAVIRNTPYGRFGEPDELIGALVYLLSDSSAFVNGQVLGVDGGFSVFSGV